jgi:hypothetical protein
MRHEIDGQFLPRSIELAHRIGASHRWRPALQTGGKAAACLIDIRDHKLAIAAVATFGKAVQLGTCKDYADHVGRQVKCFFHGQKAWAWTFHCLPRQG